MLHARRTLLAALALAPWLAPGAARAQPRADADYTVLRQELPVETPGRIEVIEFFWYGCPACYQFEPLIEAWIPKLPAEAQFRRIPAVFNQRWARDASLYYAFEALGLVEKLHRPLYDAIHRDRLRTDNPEAMAQWLQRHGLEAKRVEDTVKSFGVQSKVRRSAQLGAAYRIDGTPTLAVHGRYTVKIEQARSFENMIAIADHLIGVARKGLAAKK